MHKYGIDLSKYSITSTDEVTELLRLLFLSHISCSRVVEILNGLSDVIDKGELTSLKSDLQKWINKDVEGKSNNEAYEEKLHSWSEYFNRLEESEVSEYVSFNGMKKEVGKKTLLAYNLELADSPQAIKHMLDKYVIGQESAKESISFAFYLHLIRIGMVKPPILRGSKLENTYHIHPLPKPSMMLIGQTGSGKTYIIKTLCKMFDVPFVKIDCASLTSSGYIGKGFNDYLMNLYKKVGKDSSKMEKAIIYFDEIDKVSEHHTKRSGGSVGGIELQQEFLNFLEDDTIILESTKGRREGVSFSGENLMFIFSGSFAGIETLVEKRIGSGASKSGIGFNQIRTKQEDGKTGNYLDMVSSADLIEFGVIPELVGRINFFESLHPLTADDVIKIMRDTKDSPLEKYHNFFKVHLDELIIEDEVYKLIADKVIEKGGGGRSITGVLQELLNPLLFKAPNMKKEVFKVDKNYFNQVIN